MRSLIARSWSAARAATLILCLVLPASVMSAGSDDPAPVTLEVQLAGGARGSRQLTVDLSGTADLPRSAFRTSTIWTAGRARFAGVRLHDLLVHLGVDSGRVTLRAANGYTAEIPVAEVRPKVPCWRSSATARG